MKKKTINKKGCLTKVKQPLHLIETLCWINYLPAYPYNDTLLLHKPHP